MASRLADLVSRVILREMGGGPRLTRVSVPTFQGQQWTWCLLFFDALEAADPIPQLPPLQLTKGELFGIAGAVADTYYSALEDFNCSQVTKDTLDDPAIQDSMPVIVREKLAEADPNPPFLFLRLKPEVMPLDADGIAADVRQLTWLKFHALPDYLATREVRIEIGAQKASIKPTPAAPAVEFQVGNDYFAGYLHSGSRSGIRYNACGKDGLAHTFTVNLDVFLELIGFPIQEGYGYEYALPLDFDALLKTCDNVEHTVQESLRKLDPVAKEKVFALVRAQVGKTREEYMRRLDERKQSLLKRKKLYLGSRWLGYAPTNENEVLILSGKVEEALGKTLAEFLILEHTSRIDIDGMARIRRSNGLNLEESAMVEFEFSLENFFKHRHPFAITNYIICWTLGPFHDGAHRFGHKGLSPEGPLTVNVSTSGWIRVLSFHENMIYVLPLEHFPGLSIQPAK